MLGMIGLCCQGYVSEIMLTLESAVDNLDVTVCPLVKDSAFMSTPNLTKEPVASSARDAVHARDSVGGPSVGGAASTRGALVVGSRASALLSSPFTHIRSTSHNLAALSRKAIVSSPPILENKGSQSNR